jgi:hypothetical protein
VEKVEKKLPRGILIITIVTIISGILLLLMSFYVFYMLLPYGPMFLIGPSFLLIMGVTSFLAAYGLYRVRTWAWKLLLILSGFGLAGYLWNVVNGQYISIVGVVYNAIIIWYMYKPQVRNYYGLKRPRRRR